RDGSPAGERIPVSVPASLSRHGAHLAIGPGGRFAVAWNADDETTGPFEDAVARRFRADGSPDGPEILVAMGEPAIFDSSPVFALARGVALQQDGTLDVLYQVQGDYLVDTYVLAYLPSGKTEEVRIGYAGLTAHYATAPDTGAALATAPDGRLIGVFEH